MPCKGTVSCQELLIARHDNKKLYHFLKQIKMKDEKLEELFTLQPVP